MGPGPHVLLVLQPASHVAPPQPLPGLCPRPSSPPTLPPGVSSPGLFWLEMPLDAGASRIYSSRSRLPQVLQVWTCSYLCNRCASSQPISQSACTPPPAQPFFLQPFPSRRQETPLYRVLRPRMQSSPSPFSLTPHPLHGQPRGAAPSKCLSLKPDQFSSPLPRTTTSMTTRPSSLCLDDLGSVQFILSRAATVAPFKAKSAVTPPCSWSHSFLSHLDSILLPSTASSRCPRSSLTSSRSSPVTLFKTATLPRCTPLPSFLALFFYPTSSDLLRTLLTPAIFFSLIYKFIYLFILFIFGCVGSLLLCGLSLVAVSGGYSSLWCVGFSLSWLLLLRSMGSRHAGFSSCGMRAQ